MEPGNGPVGGVVLVVTLDLVVILVDGCPESGRAIPAYVSSLNCCCGSFGTRYLHSPKGCSLVGAVVFTELVLGRICWGVQAKDTRRG